MYTFTSSVATLAFLTHTFALPSGPRRDAASSYVAFPFSKTSKTKLNHLTDRAFTSSLTNQGIYYTIDVEIGTPPQKLSLVLDTGSSEVWGYAPESASSCSGCTATYYDPTLSSTAADRSDLGPFSITYQTVDSGVSGFYVSDTFVTNGVSTPGIIIGVATIAHTSDPMGGIMGISLPSGESSQVRYPGYIDQLQLQGLIDVRAYSIYLNDLTPISTTTGTIIFGGYDSTKWLGELISFPLIEPSPDGSYRLDIFQPSMSIFLNGQSAYVPAGIVPYAIVLDTGTTVARIPQTSMDFIAAALSATLIQSSGGVSEYSVDCSYANVSGGLGFTFSGPNGDAPITVPWPELVFTDSNSGLPSGQCLLGLFGEPDTKGPYTFGDTFLRSAYLLYNFDAGTISLAQASYDNSCSDCIGALT